MGGKAHSNSSPLWYPLLLSNIPGTLFLVFLPSASMWLKAALCMQYPTDLSKHLHSTVQYITPRATTHMFAHAAEKNEEKTEGTLLSDKCFQSHFFTNWKSICVFALPFQQTTTPNSGEGKDWLSLKSTFSQMGGNLIPQLAERREYAGSSKEGGSCVNLHRVNWTCSIGQLCVGSFVDRKMHSSRERRGRQT